MTSRRSFLSRTGLGLAGVCLPARSLLALSRLAPHPPGPHPVPRPGITGAKVLTAEQLTATPELVSLFDGVRAIPGVVDGIRCNCGCADSPGFYSLLSCYEADGMARHCPICQGQARLTVRLHKAGKSLGEIRVAIDAQFGD